MPTTFTYTPAQLAPYVNWIYFFHAWGIPPRFASVATAHDCPGCRAAWTAGFDGTDHEQARVAASLFDEARQTLAAWQDSVRIRARFGLFPAQSDGDDLLLSRGATMPPARLPLLRQQTATHDGAPCLCLADFISPAPAAGTDPVRDYASHVGLFATAVEEPREGAATPDGTLGVQKKGRPDDDPYRRMMHQTLCDRLAEAAAELLHADVRRRHWGYAPLEDLHPQQLFDEKYQGIRPAVGYPSLPDLSLNFLIDELIDMQAIGIRLTENGMMTPHAAVSGLMLAHPAATYFAVGPIDTVQLNDYALRRGIAPTRLRQFLAANLRQ